MNYAILLLITLTAPSASVPGSALPPIWGEAQVIDGDTLQIRDTKVRLFGIDAPEADQTCERSGSKMDCGWAAADQLVKLVAGHRVFCTSMGVDQYGRFLGRCVVGAININETLVALGYAVAYRRYSTVYIPAEERAKASKRGLWAGTFQMPDEYRRASQSRVHTSKRRSGTAPSSKTGFGRTRANCNIKGNRNRKGQWIYHLPGMPYYDQTRPEEIFCTEVEAQAAGYRRAIVR